MKLTYTHSVLGLSLQRSWSSGRIYNRWFAKLHREGENVKENIRWRNETNRRFVRSRFGRTPRNSPKATTWPQECQVVSWYVRTLLIYPNNHQPLIIHIIIAEGLNQMKGIRVNVTAVETNMVRIITTIIAMIKSAICLIWIMPLLYRFSWIWRMVQDLLLRNFGRL